MRIQILIISCLVGFIACNNKLSIKQVDKNKFCKYFEMEGKRNELKKNTYQTMSVKINKLPHDEVSDFIQNHELRFSYLTYKILENLITNEKSREIDFINSKFCNTLQADSFYKQFVLLTCGRQDDDTMKVSFSIPELMKIASRFFSCDSIQKEDTLIAYHICIGNNGISELKSTRDYTVLEAFCIEAIFNSLNNHPKFIGNFNNYVIKSSNKYKQAFESFETHLKKVEYECYAEMEKDKDLQLMLMNYYHKNRENIGFRIE
jgi:hypothetical protein